VLDHQNVLKELVSEKALEANDIEKFEGVITPGFINAHCHLELSHLKGRIPKHTGLPSFAKQIITVRDVVSKEEISATMRHANLEMWNNGIVAVGDISNTEDSFEEKINCKIYYHTFVELIGLNPSNHLTIYEKGLRLLKILNEMGLSGSLAPHAPYSTSRELIKMISAYNNEKNHPLSIHNQESEEESKFFNGQPNGFEELYRSLGLDLSWYRAPGTSSLLHYWELLSDKPSLLVHNTFTKSSEIDITKDKNIYWCFCPGANKYIGNRLPDFSIFENKKNKIVIGTDSLASNDALNVSGEANLILSDTNVFSPEDLLRALTINGAEALGISGEYGQFIPGKNTGLNLIDTKNSKINFLKKIA